MLNLKVETRGLDFKKLSQGDRKLLMEGNGAIIEGHIQDIITADHIVDSGRYRNTINSIADENSAVIQSFLHYAPHIEYGTRPHVIRPKTKKALSWKGAIHPVRKVNHPGTKARFPFTRGVVKSKVDVAKFSESFIMKKVSK